MLNLETNRLLLRMFTLDDLGDLANIFGNPNVMKYLGLDGKPISMEETETALISIIKHWEQNGFGRWAVVHKESGALIGCSGLRSYEGSAELIYLIDEPYWGKGLATEIAFACLAYGFNKMKFDTIIAFSRPGNVASRRVMEKIGMKYVQDIAVFGVFVVKYGIQSPNYLLD